MHRPHDIKFPKVQSISLLLSIPIAEYNLCGGYRTMLSIVIVVCWLGSEYKNQTQTLVPQMSAQEHDLKNGDDEHTY